MGSSLFDSKVRKPMAKKEHWEIDPWDDAEILKRVAGKVLPNVEEDEAQARQIFYGQGGVRCLEIGAGYGRLLTFARRYFTECTGIDRSIFLVARSTLHLKDVFNCKVVLSDGLAIPFEDRRFDFVYSFTCFQHMEDLETIQQNLREAYRVLRSDGQCRIQTVLGDRDESGRYDGYVFESVTEFADEMERAGFKNVVTSSAGEWMWSTGVKS